MCLWSVPQYSLQRLFVWVLRPLEVWPPPSRAIDISLLIQKAVERPTRIKVTHTNHPVTWGAKRNPDNRPYSDFPLSLSLDLSKFKGEVIV